MNKIIKLSEFTSLINEEDEVFNYLEKLNDRIGEWYTIPTAEYLKSINFEFTCCLIWYDKVFNVICLFRSETEGFKLIRVDNFTSHFEFNCIRFAQSMGIDTDSFIDNCWKTITKVAEDVKYQFDIKKLSIPAKDTSIHFGYDAGYVGFFSSLKQSKENKN